MQETELHDLSDDADYAASQQQGSSSMMSTDSIKRSSSNEPDGSEIVYSKDNVAIHPTQFVSERISGRLKLIKQGSSLFMTWLPYKEQNSNAKQIEKAYVDRNLYTIKAVPFTEVRSIRKHAPPLGWQYVIIVLSSGLAFPPFYFYNGGVRQFLATIKQHVFLVRSAEDASVFLVNDFENPLQRTFSSLELPRVVSVASGQSTPISGDESPLKENQERINGYESSSISQYNGRQRQKVHDPARDISIQVLEKFSLVTKFARETTSQLFRDGHSNGFGSFEKMFDSQPAQDDLHKASNNVERVTDEIAVASDPLEFDKLSLVWGKPRQPPLGSEENFVKFLSGMNLKLEGKGGVHQDMVSYMPAQSNPNKVIIARLALSTVIPLILIGLLETVEEPDLLHTKVEPPPLSEEWATFLDNEGRVMDSEALRKRIFYGGVEHELRREVWGLLLGYYAYDSTYAEREYLRTIKKSEYETIKHQWQSISPEQARRFTKFRERKGLIDKDVVRTDRAFTFYDGDDNPNVNLLRDTLLTYSFYNFDLGYCQGMSDLMSPILFVMEDESESFWCFVQLMERLGPNFNRDQSGMHSQLFALSKLVELLDSPLHNYFKQNECLNYFFCFRWLLIQFKREFEYEETMRLWEVLWTHYLSEHLHLYVCVAVLKRYRRKIMGEQMDFDTLLKFINELSGRINLDAILRDAEALCICAGENGAANIPPGTPPSLPIDSGLFYSQQEDEVL